nr:hypothetical protein [Tanacetum cinerariifolium]
METTIEQQVAMDEALVPSAQSATIRTLTDVNINKLYQPWRSFTAIINKCLTGKTPHKRNVDYAFLIWEDFVFQVEQKNQKKSNEIYYPRFTKVIIHHFMLKDLSIPRRNNVNWHYVRDDFMFSTIKLVSRHQNTQQFDALLPIELTNEEIRNSKAHKEYYAIATGEAVPKPKASAKRTRSGSDTSITPPTAAGTPRLIAASKGKQTAKAPKGKSLSALFEPDGSGTDEGTGSKPGVPDVPTDKSKEELSWNSSDDEGADDKGKDGSSDEEDDDEETRDEESFDPIPQTPESSEDEGDGEEDLGLNISKEERQGEEEEEDELYRDVKINQGRGLQGSLEVEDTHVTLTPVKPNGQQESSSVSSQFVTNMLNPTLDIGMESIFETTSQTKVIGTNLSEVIQTNQFAGAVSAITGIVQHYMDQRMNEEVKVAKIEGNKSIQCSDEQRNLYKALVEAYESDKIILDTYGETLTLKRRRDDDADKDEEPSVRPDQGSKRCKEVKEPESASTPSKTATNSAGRSTTGYRSRQASHPEWFSKPKKPPSPNRDWNKTLPAVHGSIQPWISELEKQANTHSSFNELMDTPLDFSNFIMNRLRVNTLTPELLAGPTYDLPLPLIPNNQGRRVIPFAHFINNDLEYLHGGTSSRKYTTSVTKTKAADYEYIKWIEDLVPKTMWIQEPIDYNKHALWGRRIIAVTKLKIVKWHSYKHLDWITVRRDDDKLYKFKEDLQLGVESYQKKLNLTKPDMYRSDLKCKEAYTTYSNPRGFIYQNKDKQNRLMRIDELHKFNDETLTNVRTTLDDRLKGIRMLYLPQTI